MNTNIWIGVTAAAALCVSMTLVPQDTQEASAPSPEALERMSPGPMHEKLEPLVGEFTMKGKWRMTPEAPWEEFEAEVSREWIMDGRFVHETVESEFMDQPFRGMGIIGYDNTREEFTMVWIENLSTSTWTSTGRLEDGKLVFEGENSNCMTGEKSSWSKSVITLGGERETYEGYAKDADGEVFQNMEMVSTRK